MKPIARIRSDFATKFGIPRQSGVVGSLQAEIVFEPEFRSREAVRGLDGYSHIWLIWEFSENVRAGWSPTVRPPRLGGNVRMGVFAYFGSFTWAGAAVKNLAAFGEKMKWEVVGVPVEQKQALKADKYEECWALGEEMAKKLKTEN